MSKNTSVVKSDAPEVYTRVLSENEFRIRQYHGNAMTSKLNAQRVLRMVQFCHEAELFMVDFDLTQCFKCGWLLPGYRMIRAFGFNPAGEGAEERAKLLEFLRWLQTRAADGDRWDLLDELALLGTYGVESERGELLRWIKSQSSYGDIKSTDIEKLVAEFKKVEEEEQHSPMWLEIAAVIPADDTPQEIRDSLSQGVEDPKLVIKAGFKQNDSGYYVMVPQGVAFHRTVGGLFNPIEQKSYYPYYPFTAREQELLLLGVKKLLSEESSGSAEDRLPVPENHEPTDEPCLVHPRGTTNMEELLALQTTIEGIRDERGPQTPPPEPEA